MHIPTQNQNSEVFHNRLKRLRVNRGLSVRELASKINVPLTTYREWEYGRSIKGEPYPKLAAALGVSVLELLTGEKISTNQLLTEVEDLEGRLKRLKEKIRNITG